MNRLEWILATPILAVAFALVAVAPSTPRAENIDFNNPEFKPYINGDKWSSYLVSTPETRAMNDEFNNPGFLWVDIGREEWAKVEGEAGKSCASCHNDPESMKGVSTVYPKYSEKTQKMMTLEHQINTCRTEQMKADAWKWESDQMLGVSAMVRSQSRGMPVNVSIDGPAAPFYEKGKAIFNERRGQMDIACKHCHRDHAGQFIRADLLGMAMTTGFPTYRLKWQGLGSLHRRFKGCMTDTRGNAFEVGSDEFTNLELFTTHEANGLPVESPAVRR